MGNDRLFKYKKGETMIISLGLIYMALKYGHPVALWGLLITWIPDTVLIACLTGNGDKK